MAGADAVGTWARAAHGIRISYIHAGFARLRPDNDVVASSEGPSYPVLASDTGPASSGISQRMTTVRRTPASSMAVTRCRPLM